MLFEYDTQKSTFNKRKHGIDFAEVQQLWEDPNAIAFDAKTATEARFVVVGVINGKHWSTVATNRDNRVRLISVSRSRRKEVQLYEENQGI